MVYFTNFCLYTKHQNFALYNQALRKLSHYILLNSKKFIEDDLILEKIKAETLQEYRIQEITFGQWKYMTKGGRW